MRLSTEIFLTIPALVILSLGAACSQTAADGGLFKSSDLGQTWEQKVYAGQQGRKTLNIGDFNTTNLTQDPSNPLNLFLGTEENGLWYSGDGGEQWGQVSQISSGNIRDVLFDPSTPTTIYVVQDNKILKTIDSGATWETAYTESSGKAVIDIDLNPQAPSLLYAGLESGRVIRSNDAGVNWSIILSESSKPIVRVVVLPNQPSTLFAVEYLRELWRSTDAGNTWERMNETHIKKAEGAGAVLKMYVDQQNPGTLYSIAQNAGLIRSDDSGENWGVVKTLVGKSSDSITAFMIDPFNSQHLYLGLGTFIHESVDRGATWNVIETFPSSRNIVLIKMDTQNPQVVYAGTKAIPKKGGLFGKR